MFLRNLLNRMTTTLLTAITVTSLSVAPIFAQTHLSLQADTTTTRSTTAGSSPSASVPPIDANGSYIIALNNAEKLSPEEVIRLATGIADKYQGKLEHIYTTAFQGFAAIFPPEMLEAIKQAPEVAYITEDGVVELATDQSPVPSWGLDRVDQHDLPLNVVYSYQETGAGVNVYVIDSGIDASHSDFQGRVSGGVAIVGSNTNDCLGHGTHVAGTIGGTSFGIAKDVQLHPVRVFECENWTQWSTVIAGIDWVTQNHQMPAVVNMSLGGLGNPALDQAIQTSIAHGLVYVVAAGNSNTDACAYSPARVGDAITVGASTKVDQRAWFSNYGRCLDLFAPGEQIISAIPGNGQASYDGTSMAAPHVAGVAAIYLEKDPTATPAVIADSILNTATTGRLSGIGSGSPNNLLYIGNGNQAPTCVTFVTQNLTSNRFSALPNNRLQAVVWYDGASNANNPPTLRIQYQDPATATTGWIIVGGSTDPGGAIDSFVTQIETREYDLSNCVLTGLVEVAGVNPDGVIDGMAFGLYIKNAQGQYDLWQSQSNNTSNISDFVGGWPVGVNDPSFAQRTPQITDGVARQQAQMTLLGAKYLGNGQYQLQ